MLSGKLYDNGQTIYRILAARDDVVLTIDCVKRTMPVWLPREKLSEWQEIEEHTLNEKTCICPVTEDTLSKSALSTAHKRYSIIAPVVAVVADKKKRNDMIEFATQNSGISKQTIRQYLCLYFAFQTITMLAPVNKIIGSKLTKAPLLKTNKCLPELVVPSGKIINGITGLPSIHSFCLCIIWSKVCSLDAILFLSTKMDCNPLAIFPIIGTFLTSSFDIKPHPYMAMVNNISLNDV